MQDWSAIQVLSQLAITSEYFLQVTLDKSGKVLSSDSGLGPIPSLFDSKEKPILFSDCFSSSDWSKYENQRIKAWKNSHQSFLVDLQKINHPDLTTTLTKWEFFFITEDFGTCLGIGHPLESKMPYSLGMGEIMDGNFGKNEILDTLLENKLLGFWEFDPSKFSDQISPGLAIILGYTQESDRNTIPVPWKNHIHPDDFPSLDRELKMFFRTSGNLPFKKEFRIISQNNQAIWVVGFGKTSRWSKDGTPEQIRGLLIDITERKKQEIWLREHHYFLKDLAFQQSHSMRARVANIIGILEILETEVHTAETRKLLTIIRKEVQMLDESLKKSIKESVLQNESLENGISPES